MKKPAFTLIELLIVITIIGILAVALLPSVLGAPARARDAQRKADLKNIVAALESFNSDYGHYPDSLDNCIHTLMDGASLNVLNNYFQGGKAPRDPQATGRIPGGGCLGGYGYTVGDGKPVSYVLGSYMEQQGDMNTSTKWPDDKGGKVSFTTQPKLTPGVPGNTYYAIVK